MSKIIGPQYADKFPCGHVRNPGVNSCFQCEAEARRIESTQRTRDFCEAQKQEMEMSKLESQSRPSSFPSHQPSSFQFQPQQPQQSQQSYQDPMAGVDQDFWNLKPPQVGSGGIIYGTFLWILIGGAIWLFVAVLPFLLALLGFLFSAALVIGAVIGVIWLIAKITDTFSGE